jgi:hypothetical protein
LSFTRENVRDAWWRMGHSATSRGCEVGQVI